jgi:hypothetical protein
VGVVEWGRDLAEVYDAVYGSEFAPSVLEPEVGLLAELAQGGRALEFGIGTGRVALPLRDRGVVVEGISCPSRWRSSSAPRPAAGTCP